MWQIKVRLRIYTSIYNSYKIRFYIEATPRVVTQQMMQHRDAINLIFITYAFIFAWLNAVNEIEICSHKHSSPWYRNYEKYSHPLRQTFGSLLLPIYCIRHNFLSMQFNQQYVKLLCLKLNIVLDSLQEHTCHFLCHQGVVPFLMLKPVWFTQAIK